MKQLTSPPESLIFTRDSFGLINLSELQPPPNMVDRVMNEIN